MLIVVIELEYDGSFSLDQYEWSVTKLCMNSGHMVACSVIQVLHIGLHLILFFFSWGGFS